MLVMVKRLSVLIVQILLIMVKGLCFGVWLEIMVGPGKAYQTQLQLGYLVVYDKQDQVKNKVD